MLTIAGRLIAEAGSLAGLIAWPAKDFRAIKGIGRVKANQLVTVMEVARRVVGQQAGEAPLLSRAEFVAAYFQPLVAGLEVEKFWVLCLNRKNRLIKRALSEAGCDNLDEFLVGNTAVSFGINDPVAPARILVEGGLTTA